MAGGSNSLAEVNSIGQPPSSYQQKPSASKCRYLKNIVALLIDMRLSISKVGDI